MTEHFGMSRDTGKTTECLEHLKQSIIDILTTPIGSRVARHDYGSRLPELIDAPINRENIVDIYAATAEALAKHEDRIELSGVDLQNSALGKITLSITAKYKLDGQVVRIDGIEITS
ncbi:MAG: GPW/gp25 family protein [Pseudomonadota bacterium]|nr:GPW/gp25 family protein [Pseudomonadota bacterium]